MKFEDSGSPVSERLTDGVTTRSNTSETAQRIGSRSVHPAFRMKRLAGETGEPVTERILELVPALDPTLTTPEIITDLAAYRAERYPVSFDPDIA